MDGVVVESFSCGSLYGEGCNNDQRTFDLVYQTTLIFDADNDWMKLQIS